MENINMNNKNNDNFYFNVRAGYFAILVTICSFGIHHQLSKTIVSPVPIERVAQGKNLKPLQPLNASEICSTIPRCAKLAEVLVYEARGESDVGKAAVAQVVINRTKDPRWGDSIKEVIHQPHQFSYLKDKHKQSKPTADDWNTAMKIAHGVISGTISNPVGEATHYHATRVKPKWAKKLEPVAKIGQHVFYR